MQLLAERGLQGTSINDVLAATGAPRGSVYHHFPGGKRELVTAAVERLGRDGAALLARSGATTPEEVVGGFAALFRRLLIGSDLRSGCGVAAVTVGAGASDDELFAVASAAFWRWREALATALAATGVERAEGARLAVIVVAALEGAMIVARAERSIEPFDVVADHLRQLVGG